MTEESTSSPKQRQERVTLSPSGVERLDRWVGVVSESYPGIQVSRTDLVNWLVDRHAERLSGTEVAAIRDAFFSEEQLVAWAVREARRLSDSGEKSSVIELIVAHGSGLRGKSRVPRRPRREKGEPEPREEGTEGHEDRRP